MAKLTINPLPTRKKIIPLVMAISNAIMVQLRFSERINETIKWDRSHWNISPGGLLKILVLSTMTDIRVPLSHLEDRLEGMDIEYFLEPSDKSTFVNESNVGEALERLGEADFDGLYESMALSALRQYEIPVTRLHNDTTTISFYGDYDPEKLDLTAEEKETLLHIERGYNKDGRPECKQAVVGQITTEHGIPVVNRVLDGSTSDIEWNREAIQYVSKIAEAGFSNGVFVADCKLVTEEHITAMNDPERRIRFVSRCPANFAETLERRMIARAYENGRWNEIGPLSETKKAAQYKSLSFIEEVYGTPMRLMVLESNILRQKAEQAVAKKEEALAPYVRALEKQRYRCQADAEAARKQFLSMKLLALFDCSIRIEKRTTEKWPKGRRSSKTQPTITDTYHLRADKITKREPACQSFIQNGSCFVLISNVTAGMSDVDLLKTYKGQQVVENSFRALKSPQLASVIYLQNPKRIQALTMLLTFSLLIRALIQYRLREGLKSFNEEHPGEAISAGWGGRPLENPTFKLLYEHSINCCFERENWNQYSFSWPSIETKSRVAPLLVLLGVSLEELLM